MRILAPVILLILGTLSLTVILEAAPGSFKIDACALLTKAEVQEAIGEPVASPSSRINTAGDARLAAVADCSFDSAKDGSSRSIAILVRKSSRPDYTPDAIAKYRKELVTNGFKLEDVPGLGIAAFWSANLVKQLTVFRDGTAFFNLTVFGFTDASAARKKAVDLARKALKRL